MFSIDPKVITEYMNLFSIILVTLILIIVIIILVRINRGLDQKIKEKEEKTQEYDSKLQKLRELKPTEENLDNLNKMAREFFREKFDLKVNFTYLELAEKFKKDKQEENQEFCEKMSELVYSGKTAKEEEIRKVIDLFSKVLIKSKEI
ncbi:MAG: hypothetical protein WC979_05705 [Candidatus Pacearchaeota archaeon]|jgi:biopolymer transport protein ExbB/TolQ